MFELPGLVDEARLNRYLLPVAYVAERVSDNKFYVLSEENRSVVGVCEVEEPFVRVSFFTVKSAGRDFATAFGVEHPECDPKTLFFGFVYRSPDGLYRLDKIPLRLRSEAVKKIKDYVSARNVFMVSFYRGEWTDTSLEVLSMRKVFAGAALGDEKGPCSLTLGNIENESTV